MTALPEDVVADLSRLVAELEQRLESSLVVYDKAIAQQAVLAQENARLQSELATARDHEAASAEILRTISEVSGDAERSLQQIAGITARLFGASSVRIRLADHGEWGRSFYFGRSSEAIVAAVPDAQRRIGGRNLPGTVVAENRQIHVGDLDHIDPDMAAWPGLPVARAAGARTISGTPLRREGKATGVLIIHRDTLLPFTAAELALQQSFADQAAIAAENARLFNETREALERQTATADILRVISQSPTDVQPVFDAIAQTAVRLLRCDVVGLLRCDGVFFSPAAEATQEGLTANPTARNVPIDPAANFPSRVIVEKKPLHLPDYSQIELPEHERRIQTLIGVQSALFLPLLRDDSCIGVLAMTCKQHRKFSEGEIALAESYRDQALIAIENVRLFNETREALERQTATADILQVIAGSPSDVQPIFDAIVKSAAELFGPCGATITTLKDGKLHWEATETTLPGFDFVRTRSVYPIPFDPDRAPSARAILERRIIEIPDVEAPDTPEYTRKAAAAGGFRSITFVPLVNQDQGIGTIILNHPQPGYRLSDKQLALVQTFADQAVIAIQNARLFNETQEALERQTATADILKVIASSPSDVQPVFDAIATSANRLLGGFSTTVFRFIDGMMHLKAFTPTSPAADELLQASFPLPLDTFPIFAMVGGGQTAQFIDTEAADVPPAMRELARSRGFRSMLFTPLISNGLAIGMIGITRPEPGAFADHHIQLLQTFADQAVIAIENARLFDEVQARTNDLTESLQQQTATSDVLKVISRSVFDLQIVLDTLVESAYRLCGADLGLLYLRGDEAFECKAIAGDGVAEANQLFKGRPIHAGRGTAAERVILTGEVHAITDFETDPELDPRVRDYLRNAAEAGSLAGRLRSSLAVPMTRDDAVVGVMVIARAQTGPFPARQVELLQTFADQAVIAIENARLFDEVQARTAELSEALQQQTATADVLKVISRSTFDLQTVLETLITSAVELSGGNRGSIFLREGDVFPLKAASSTTPEFLEYWAKNPARAGRGSATSRVIASGKIEIIPDVLEDPEMQMTAGALVRIRGTLGVPMLRDDKVEGVLVLTRPEPGPFSKSQIDLVQTFADQAVIAVENVRLFDEAQARTRELATSLEELRTAQDRLVQTEKLASLGQLTAGIAHEIKNPLNFVNNFSALSAELTDELNDVLKNADLADKMREEVDELTGLLKDNLQKVVQHGQRADSIVKNMLLHSREGSGDHRPADINALVDESLNLAYHGARAEKPQFNVTLERDFDPDAGMIELFPQEITRVFLNLIGNGFYAVTRRKAENPDGFDPVVRASTRDLGDQVEIRIRDNGTGIPPEVKEKMFNPFFTTKPAGEGTGLGLSMSHDIIVKQHGGSIDVETEPGQFTEFTVLLPRTGNVSKK
jgi:GAF domain-containing protein